MKCLTSGVMAAPLQQQPRRSPFHKHHRPWLWRLRSKHQSYVNKALGVTLTLSFSGSLRLFVAVETCYLRKGFSLNYLPTHLRRNPLPPLTLVMVFLIPLPPHEDIHIFLRAT